MKLEIEITAEQEMFLKQFAQNQKSGAKDNVSTYKPIHTVETMRKRYFPYSEVLQEFISGTVVFTTDRDDYTWIASIEECVKEYFKITEKIPPHKIQQFDSRTIKMTYQDKDGYKEYANTYEKYFEYYGIEEYEIAIEEIEWEAKSYHFTLEEAKKYMRYQGHNLNNPRTYTLSMGYGNKGDYEAFWDLLMNIGTKLNALSFEERTEPVSL